MNGIATSTQPFLYSPYACSSSEQCLPTTAASKGGGTSPVGPHAATRKSTRASSMKSSPSRGDSGAPAPAEADATGLAPGGAAAAGGPLCAAAEEGAGPGPGGDAELATASGAGARAQAQSAANPARARAADSGRRVIEAPGLVSKSRSGRASRFALGVASIGRGRRQAPRWPQRRRGPAE